MTLAPTTTASAPMSPPTTALPDAAPLLGLLVALAPVEPDAAVPVALPLAVPDAGAADDADAVPDSVELVHETFEGGV